jgi:hypothetical protein
MLSEITENGLNFNSAGEAFTLYVPATTDSSDIGAGDGEGRRSNFGAHFGV